MLQKPRPIVVLAIFHWIEPILKTAALAVFLAGSGLEITNHLRTIGPSWDLGVFFLAFPLSGLAIFAVKNWSLATYVYIQLANIVGTTYLNTRHPNLYPWWWMAAQVGAAVVTLAYLLRPTTRRAFLDPSIRWWESKPRFGVDWDANLLQGKRTLKVKVQNISEGGVFVEVAKDEALVMHEPVQVELDTPIASLSLAGRVCYGTPTTPLRYGIHFTELPPTMRSQIQSCLAQLQEQGTTRLSRPLPSRRRRKKRA